MRRRTLFKKDSGFSGNVADAVFYDSNSDSFVAMPPDEITDVIDGYTPIGVVVVPSEHDVYGDGTCGVISLVYMTCNAPDVGSGGVKERICGGGYGTDTSRPNYKVVNYLGSNGNINNGVVQGTKGTAHLPTDYDSAVTGLDGVSGYSDSSSYLAPSPYNADGSRNEAYYTTSYSTANALSDFDGVGNTRVLTDLATAQSDWKTASTITNSGDAGYYPAACCCWRFHTPGTSQGQWYFPACGEFGYVINRIKAINATIRKIMSIYSSVDAIVVLTNIDLFHGTSSEYSDVSSRSMNANSGNVSYGLKTNTHPIRAFLRL